MSDGLVTVSTAPRWLRRATAFGVVVVALVAAINSYMHMKHLGDRYGEDWRAWLSPLAIDGMALVATMTMLAKHRTGQKAGGLAWFALLIGLGASLWANIVSADPDPGARLWSALPPVFLLVSIELLLTGVRATTRAIELPREDERPPVPPPPPVAIPQHATDPPPAPEPAQVGPGVDPEHVERMVQLWRERGKRPGTPAIKSTLGVGQARAVAIRDQLAQMEPPT